MTKNHIRVQKPIIFALLLQTMGRLTLNVPGESPLNILQVERKKGYPEGIHKAEEQHGTVGRETKNLIVYLCITS